LICATGGGVWGDGRRSRFLLAAAAGGMVASGAAFTAVAAKTDRKAAAAGVPFVAWLSFATVRATAVWHRNRD